MTVSTFISIFVYLTALSIWRFFILHVAHLMMKHTRNTNGGLESFPSWSSASGVRPCLFISCSIKHLNGHNFYLVTLAFRQTTGNKADAGQ
jgi:hypothetical protein